MKPSEVVTIVTLLVDQISDCSAPPNANDGIKHYGKLYTKNPAKGISFSVRLKHTSDPFLLTVWLEFIVSFGGLLFVRGSQLDDVRGCEGLNSWKHVNPGDRAWSEALRDRLTQEIAELGSPEEVDMSIQGVHNRKLFHFVDLIASTENQHRQQLHRYTFRPVHITSDISV
jgi:hypothetical protein